MNQQNSNKSLNPVKIFLKTNNGLIKPTLHTSRLIDITLKHVDSPL